MKNKVILIITMLLVIVCTIIIYTLLFEEQNKLFYINVGIACLAEIILLANIPILSNEKLLTIKNVSLSVSLNLFAIVIFLWTAGCSLLMDQDSNLKTLYIGLLVITIIFFIINGATVIMAGGVTEKKALDIQSTIENKKMFSASIDNYWIGTKNELEKLVRCTDRVYNGGMWFMNNRLGLFLKAAGMRPETGPGLEGTGSGTSGVYLTSTLGNRKNNCYALDFGTTYIVVTDTGAWNALQINGYSVRCVKGTKQ